MQRFKGILNTCFSFEICVSQIFVHNFKCIHLHFHVFSMTHFLIQCQIKSPHNIFNVRVNTDIAVLHDYLFFSLLSTLYRYFPLSIHFTPPRTGHGSVYIFSMYIQMYVCMYVCRHTHSSVCAYTHIHLWLCSYI